MTIMTLASVLTAGIVGAAALAGCSTESPGPAKTPTGSSEIARIHRARCGACHVRVEPGQRSRHVLDSALSRHHKRVHLSDEEWGALVNYLAADTLTSNRN